MDTSHYRDLLSRFPKARVLVVGDIYLDENVYGAVTGISLEAPIPIYEVHERRHNPGAAGNAACNAAALGAKTYMIGYVGNDMNADVVRKEFAARNVDTTGVVVHPTRATNTYGKLRAGGFNIPAQEILRTDTPAPVFVEGDVEDQIIANIWQRAPEIDAIIVTDQVKSVATRRVLDAVVKCAEKYKIITVGDSRSRAGEFHGFDVMVPNDREAGIGTGIDVRDEATLNSAGAALLKICKNALVTRGQHGIRVFASDGAVDDFPTTVDPGSVIDVTGAGDTVTAAVAVSLVAGATLKDAAVIGNYAAGVAVAQLGVVTVPLGQLERVMFSASVPAKLKPLDALQGELDRLRREGKRVVWTNGCFDILHVGHITYLQKAAALGDVLVVGLNSDASVRKVKGPERPIINEIDRAFVLSALECVGLVTIFDEDSPLEILKTLKPDVYAKGGDYTLDTIVQPERRAVEAYGGKIAILPGVEGRSTTNIIARISKDAGK
ncbi:MAG: D-glycero-beta-D-manno-heptose 1-phosphate adenylyltransferase [Candidatus Hydrogenedentes bacterium]|nr:D-glycero-beta-D-manno-heptose 1-phosphate adenylyltransferase [Candidatus Hydrogenedentota bacterium]